MFKSYLCTTNVPTALTDKGPDLAQGVGEHSKASTIMSADALLQSNRFVLVNN